MYSILDKVLLEADSIEHHADLRSKYSQMLTMLSKQREFLVILSKKISETIDSKNFRRFNFLIFVLQEYGNNSPRQKGLYSLMMDFINTNIEPEQVAFVEAEISIELVLDVFWHQEEGLKHLEKSDQIKLSETLKRTATFKYSPTENGAEPFFAINKSMDLIVYQNQFGDSETLNELYLNHFDEHVRDRAKERIKKQ